MEFALAKNSHYLTHIMGDFKTKYKSPYNAIQKTTRPKDVGNLFDDILLKSNYYRMIIHPTRIEDGLLTKEEITIYEFFRKRRFEQFRPILISLIHQKELGNIEQEKYLDIIEYLYYFFISYILIGEEKSNTLQDMSAKYATKIEFECSDKVLEEFISALKRKMPDYNTFLNAFRNIGYSNHNEVFKGDKCKKRTKVVLELIERYLSTENECGEFTIEHMQPDSQANSNSCIGNLIPLEETINGNLKNKPLMEKLEYYEKSSFTTTRNITRRIKDSGLDINKRTDYLAELIYKKILNI